MKLNIIYFFIQSFICFSVFPSQGQSIHILNLSSVVFDPDVSSLSINTIQKAITKTQDVQFSAMSDDTFFDVFGENSTNGILNYISRRIHYILPFNANVIDRVFEDAVMPSKISCGAEMTNLSSALKSIDANTIRIGNEQIVTEGIGIIRLGKFFDSAECQGTPIRLLSTLVHESRHSDCNETQSNLFDPYSDNCFHQHVRCPEGHAYANQKACDDKPWGAYTLQALVLKNLYQSCANCTEEERQLILISLLDYQERIVISHNDDENYFSWESMATPPNLYKLKGDQ
jgi:hypothetical protein